MKNCAKTLATNKNEFTDATGANGWLIENVVIRGIFNIWAPSWECWQNDAYNVDIAHISKRIL